MRKWIIMSAVAATLMMVSIAVPLAMSETCNGTCFGDPVTCECETGCVVDCTHPAPFCTCSCS